MVCKNNCGGCEKLVESKTTDKLTKIFELRENFMNALQQKKPGIYPAWPVDISGKQSQQVVKNLMLKGVEEAFEAIALLRNSREHRQTEVTEIDQNLFLEEVVDAFNYFISALILVGVDADELLSAYIKKDEIIHQRLNTGY